MKRFILFIFILIIISCGKEEIINSSNKSYVLEKIKKFLPDQLTNGSKVAIFKNREGKIKEMKISVLNVNQDKKMHSSIYKVENISVFLKEENNLDYYICISLSGNLTSENNFIEYLNATLKINPIYQNIGIDIDGSPIICYFNNSIELHGRTFNNVYSNIDSSDNHQKLYYNSEHGIIGFTDTVGKLWVFSHYE